MATVFWGGRIRNWNEHAKALNREAQKRYQAKLSIEKKKERSRRTHLNEKLTGRKTKPIGRLKALLRSARHRAQKSGIEFNLKLEDLYMPEKCPALGIAILLNHDAPIDNRPTLDRMDNTKGYIKENVQVISFRANQIKSDSSLEEIEGLLNYVKKNL